MGKLVIVVMNMFESMIIYFMFIWVEVLDIVIVVREGVDVVMFFGEIVYGK